MIRVEVRPALKMEQLSETTVALFRREFGQEVQPPFAPGLVRAATAPLAWLAVRRGLGRRYQAPTFQDLARVRKPVPTRPGEGRGHSSRPAPVRPVTPRKALNPGQPRRWDSFYVPRRRRRLAGCAVRSSREAAVRVTTNPTTAREHGSGSARESSRSWR